MEEEGKTVSDTIYMSDLESPYQNVLIEEDCTLGKTTLFTFAEEPISMHIDGMTSYYRCDEKQSAEEQLILPVMYRR